MDAWDTSFKIKEISFIPSSFHPTHPGSDSGGQWSELGLIGCYGCMGCYNLKIPGTIGGLNVGPLNIRTWRFPSYHPLYPIHPGSDNLRSELGFVGC